MTRRGRLEREYTRNERERKKEGKRERGRERERERIKESGIVAAIRFPPTLAFQK